MYALINRLLTVIEQDIVPLTQQGTAVGNKVFGAAILAKDDWRLIAVATNAETENPLWHGEIACLNQYWRLSPADRCEPLEAIFLSTHEPCSLCLSAITWSGYDNFYYLFSYEDSRDAFAIPYDLRILDEVFGCANGNYRRQNAFWHSYSIVDQIAQIEDIVIRKSYEARLAVLRATYMQMSDIYQRAKTQQSIPLR